MKLCFRHIWVDIETILTTVKRESTSLGLVRLWYNYQYYAKRQVCVKCGKQRWQEGKVLILP